MTQPTYRYTTLAAVKERIPAELITSAGFADADETILRLIEDASANLNLWTRQVFQPTPEVVRTSGRGDYLLTHPSKLPIVALLKAVLIRNRTTGQFEGMDRIIPGMRNFPEAWPSFWTGSIDGSYFTPLLDQSAAPDRKIQWDVGEHELRMITIFGGFTKGMANVEFSGWWGWLEGYKAVTTTIATAIPPNDLTIMTIHVAEIVDTTTGDFIEVGDTVAIVAKAGTVIPERVELAIVNAIAVNGGGGYDLTVDKLHPYPVEIPVGAEVYSFGRVPRDLGEVAAFLASRKLAKRIAETTGETEALIAIAAIDGNLKSERTDNYSYTLGSQGGGGGGSGSGLGKFTGSAQMDLLLRQFGQPTVSVRMV